MAIMRLSAMFALISFLSLLVHQSAANEVYQFNGTVDPMGTAFTRDIAIGYALSQEVAINVIPDPSASVTYAKLAAGTQDFAVTSTRQFNNLDSKNLTSMPFFLSAIVPIYRIDSLGDLAPPLRLTMKLCALIWMGNITRWNDPRLAAINLYITLPNLPINIVYPARASAQGEAITAAMGQVSAEFAALIPKSTNPIWPIARYAASTPCIGVSCVPAAVVTTDGSIGFSALQNAIESGVKYASNLNAAESAVAPSIASQTFAFVELSTVSATSTGDDSRMASYLINAEGSNAWPIVEISWLIMKANVVNVDEHVCIRRAHLMSFVVYAYGSTQAQSIRDSHFNARIPDQGLVSLDMVYKKLRNLFMCNGYSSYQLAIDLRLQYVDVAIRTYKLAGYSEYDHALSSMLTSWSREEQKKGSSIQWAFAPTRMTNAGFEGVKSGDFDLALILQDDLNVTQKAEFDEYQKSGEYLMLPLFSYGILPVYSRKLNVNTTLPATLKMSVLSTFMLFAGQILSWSHPNLVALNPILSDANVPIRGVTYCNPNDDFGFEGTIAAKARAQTFPFLQNSGIEVGPPPNMDMLSTCPDAFFDRFALSSETPPRGIFPAPTEVSLTALLTVTSGAYSTVLYQPSFDAKLGMVDLIFSANTSTHASIQAFLNCFDVSQPVDLTKPTRTLVSPACWSMSRPIYAMVPSSFKDVNNDGCSEARHVLQLLRWLVEETSLDGSFDMAGLARVGAIPEMRHAMMKAINSVTCVNDFNGQIDTMLVSQSIRWEVSESITITGTTLSAIGLAMVLASLICLLIYRNHHALVSAAPMFLALTAVGVGLLLIAAIFLSLPASDTNCTVLSWTLQIGFMLTLAPLFMKTYRIYRVISGKKLSVVKITNTKLLSLIALGVAAELVLLIIAQIVSPLQPIETVVLQGSPIARNHIYSVCAVETGVGTALFGVEAGLKGLLLIFGGLMGFSTRRVASSVNESSNIAWSIYNVMLSLGLVALIAALIDAQGDTLIALLLFALLWIAFTTLLLNVGPRITSLASKPLDIHAQDSGARISSHGFSLLSIAAFTETKGLTAYVMALDTQLAQAKARLVQIHSGDYAGKEWTRAGANIANASQTVASSSPVVKNAILKPSAPVIINRAAPAASISSGNIQAPLLGQVNQEPVAVQMEPIPSGNNSPKQQLITASSSNRRASSRTMMPNSASRAKSPTNASTSNVNVPDMAIHVSSPHQFALSPTQSTSPKNQQANNQSINQSVSGAPISSNPVPMLHARSSSQSSKSTAKVTPLTLSGAAVVQAATQSSASSKSSAWVNDRPTTAPQDPSVNHSTDPSTLHTTHQKSPLGSMDHNDPTMSIVNEEVDALADAVQNDMNISEKQEAGENKTAQNEQKPAVTVGTDETTGEEQ